MLGWEFPPYFAGGVGIVCEALTRALSARGEEITFVMPQGPPAAHAEHVRLLVASRHGGRMRLVRVGSLLEPYQDEQQYTQLVRFGNLAAKTSAGLYGPDLVGEVQRFGAAVAQIVEDLGLQFDVIHAHDWTTFPAGLALKAKSGKPLVVHVHITEFDKTGGQHADPRVYAIEQAGMRGADGVVAVSHMVEERCVRQYHVDPARIRVVHNAVDRAVAGCSKKLEKRGKIVLFLGRVTLQKGPDYFVEAARRVLDCDPNVTFVLAGTGDMTLRLVERSAALGIGSRMLFTGFVDRGEVAQLYAIADVFVMPSVSEPFGLVALEAMDRGVPVVLSKQSGVSEVVHHALTVDFWDVDDMADKILAALAYPSMRGEMARGSDRDLAGLTWAATAARIEDIYRELTRNTP
jgi:glycosyltransferase involved in cell wall biosynthesis